MEPGCDFDLQQQYDLWNAAQRKRPKVEKFFRAARRF
jgi:plasmid maintenance system antidote protein VapI